MTRKVIRAHNPKWIDVYTAEAAKLRTAFGASLQQIDHIDGTAIAGIFTKPVIDILVQLTSLKDADERTRG